jgi:hypothetical protein
VFWDRDRRRIVAELDRFLDEDAIVRERWGLTPIATELRFGLRGSEHPAVEVALSDGRTLRFRGAADRIDRGVDGELSVVDYKTGSPREGIGLQLHVYARAARAAYGGPDTPVSAAYWYVSTKHKFAWSELEVTPGTDAAFDRTLRAIVDGIEQGVFPCALDEPGAWTYPRRSYADPDARGTRDRWRAWARKCDAPELAGYVELVAGTREEA